MERIHVHVRILTHVWYLLHLLSLCMAPAVQNVASNHLFRGVCPTPPEAIIRELDSLRDSPYRCAGTGKEYWAKSALFLGVYENQALGQLRLRKRNEPPFSQPIP